MITIDAVGQHYPRDLQKFISMLKKDEPCIIIGWRNFDTENVPISSRLGRSFANFWLLVETGQVVSDCQSGFRSYPVRCLKINSALKGLHDHFEAEVLARAVWAGIQLKTVDIEVIYPKADERISSFRPIRDNLRLSRIHAMLVNRRLLPIRHQQLFEATSNIYESLLRHPSRVLKKLLQESAST